MRSFPIWQSRSSCGGAPVGKELPRRWQLANPKWYVRSVTVSLLFASYFSPFFGSVTRSVSRHSYPRRSRKALVTLGQLRQSMTWKASSAFVWTAIFLSPMQRRISTNISLCSSDRLIISRRR